MSETCKHCGRTIIFSETREWMDSNNTTRKDHVRTGAWVHFDSDKLTDCPRRCHLGSGTVAAPMPVKVGKRDE